MKHLIAILLLVGCAPEGLGQSNPDFHVIAHRGAPQTSAENTIPSFRVASALGANALETDVCITKDGELVLWHDRDPDVLVSTIRVLGLEGLLYSPFLPPASSGFRKPVEELTAAELREHYGYKNVDGNLDPNAHIPSFDELMDWAGEDPILRAIYLDVKFENSNVAGATQLYETLISRLNADEELAGVRFYLLSVHEEIVETWKSLQQASEQDRVRLVLDVETAGAFQKTKDIGLRDISTGLTITRSYTPFRRELVEALDARERGELDSIIVWTFDDPMLLSELLYYSVDGIMTNEPNLLFRMWQNSLE